MELKPCPFCGNTHLILISHYESDGNFEKSRYFVKCSECGSVGGEGEEIWEAKSKWDRRENDDA